MTDKKLRLLPDAIKKSQLNELIALYKRLQMKNMHQKAEIVLFIIKKHHRKLLKCPTKQHDIEEVKHVGASKELEQVQIKGITQEATLFKPKQATRKTHNLVKAEMDLKKAENHMQQKCMELGTKLRAICNELNNSELSKEKTIQRDTFLDQTTPGSSLKEAMDQSEQCTDKTDNLEAALWDIRNKETSLSTTQKTRGKLEKSLEVTGEKGIQQWKSVREKLNSLNELLEKAKKGAGNSNDNIVELQKNLRAISNQLNYIGNKIKSLELSKEETNQ